MQAGLLEQGLTLMLVGMGTVFVFLTLLVAATSLMSALTAKLSPTPAAEAPVSDEEVAAISAAINRHRQH